MAEEINRPKLALDFDDTLSRRRIEDLAHRFKDRYELWIITTRYEDPADYLKYRNHKVPDNVHVLLFAAAKRLGIPKERIKFTNFTRKADTLNEYGIDVLLDDNREEAVAIGEKGYDIHVKNSWEPDFVISRGLEAFYKDWEDSSINRG